VPGIPAFGEANVVLDLPGKTTEKFMKFTANKVLEAMSAKALTLTVLNKGHEIERDGWSR
jgi:hypothetical protein